MERFDQSYALHKDIPYLFTFCTDTDTASDTATLPHYHCH